MKPATVPWTRCELFASDGTRIGQIRLPEVCSNVCFAGSKLNRLFMTASQSLYALWVETRDAHPLGGWGEEGHHAEDADK